MNAKLAQVKTQIAACLEACAVIGASRIASLLLKRASMVKAWEAGIVAAAHPSRAGAKGCFPDRQFPALSGRRLHGGGTSLLLVDTLAGRPDRKAH